MSVRRKKAVAGLRRVLNGCVTPGTYHGLRREARRGREWVQGDRQGRERQEQQQQREWEREWKQPLQAAPCFRQGASVYFAFSAFLRSCGSW